MQHNMTTKMLYQDLHEWLQKNSCYVDNIINATGEGVATVVTGYALAKEREWSTVMVAKEAWKNNIKESHKSITVHPQFADDFGEHDLSLDKEEKKQEQEQYKPSTILEVKRAKQAGNSAKQNQVIQPFCLFINDIFFSCLNKRLNDKENNHEYGAILYIEKKLYSPKEDSDSPWKQLFKEIPSKPKENSIIYEIAPHLAKDNSGRGSKTRPDFTDPNQLQKRHISLMLTCGTNGKLLGIFKREKYTLRLKFSAALFEVQDLVACVCIAEGLELFDSENNKIVEEDETLLRWLP